MNRNLGSCDAAETYDGTNPAESLRGAPNHRDTPSNACPRPSVPMVRALTALSVDIACVPGDNDDVPTAIRQRESGASRPGDANGANGVLPHGAVPARSSPDDMT